MLQLIKALAKTRVMQALSTVQLIVFMSTILIRILYLDEVSFNQADRSMSNISKELSGVILPRDHSGKNLNNNSNTVDEKLESKSFKHACEILFELLSKLVINNHPVVAEFVGKELSDITITKSEEWKANHVRESQYLYKLSNALTQLVAFHSNYHT